MTKVRQKFYIRMTFDSTDVGYGAGALGVTRLSQDLQTAKGRAGDLPGARFLSCQFFEICVSERRNRDEGNQGSR
jgi:hypothetical protein